MPSAAFFEEWCVCFCVFLFSSKGQEVCSAQIFSCLPIADGWSVPMPSIGLCFTGGGVLREGAKGVAWCKFHQKLDRMWKTLDLSVCAGMEMRSDRSQHRKHDDVEQHWKLLSSFAVWWRNTLCVSSCWQLDNQLGNSSLRHEWLKTFCLSKSAFSWRSSRFCGKPQSRQHSYVTAHCVAIAA